MGKNIIIQYTEGYSASSKKDEKTLSAIVEPILADHQQYIAKQREVRSTMFFPYRKMKEWIFDKSIKNPKLFLIGKSMGAYNTIRFCNKYYKEMIKHFNAISIITIDPHAPLFLAGKFRDLTLNKGIKSFWQTRITNFFQQNEYPNGASVKNVDMNVRLVEKNVNHWNIIKNKRVIIDIESGLEYLT